VFSCLSVPVYHSQGDSSKECGCREIVFGFDDSEPGFGAGDDEVEAADANHSMQGRTQSRLDNAEAETDDDHQHPEEFKKSNFYLECNHQIK